MQKQMPNPTTILGCYLYNYLTPGERNKLKHKNGREMGKAILNVCETDELGPYNIVCFTTGDQHLCIGSEYNGGTIISTFKYDDDFNYIRIPLIYSEQVFEGLDSSDMYRFSQAFLKDNPSE